MKKTPTFLEQYNKIVGAYMRNELEPYQNCACFVGNLLNNTDDWSVGRCGLGLVTSFYEWYNVAAGSIYDNSEGLYTVEEVVALEAVFMDGLEWGDVSEEQLYNAMERTLLALKELHERKGEIIEPYTFTKREAA